MSIVSILPHAEFGHNNQQEAVPHFMFGRTKMNFLSELRKKRANDDWNTICPVTTESCPD